MRKLTKKFFAPAVALCLVASLFMGSANAQASEKSDGAQMEKVLKYYKAKEYTKAQKASKKLPSAAKEKCISNMSKNMKKVYRKKIKSYVSKYGIDIDVENYGTYVWDYFLTDLDNDGKAELLIQYGSCEADVRFAAFKYKSGKAKKIGTMSCAHAVFSAYPNHKGFVIMSGHMGYESVRVVKISNGKLKSVSYGERELTENSDYLNPGCLLRSHRRYNSDYSKCWFNYPEL